MERNPLNVISVVNVSVRQHKRTTHNREKQIECDRFTLAGNLRGHKPLHTCEKPIKDEQPDDSHSISEFLSDIEEIKQEEL